MSHSQFRSINSLYLDMHGLVSETSICYWQGQPGSYLITTESESSVGHKGEVRYGQTLGETVRVPLGR